MLTIDIDDREVLDTLNKVLGRINNLAPALWEIGEDLTESTTRQFATSTARVPHMCGDEPGALCPCSMT